MLNRIGAAIEVPLGCILAGPPCGLWTFMNSSFHKREELNGFFGNQNETLIRGANQLIRELCNFTLCGSRPLGLLCAALLMISNHEHYISIISTHVRHRSLSCDV